VAGAEVLVPLGAGGPGLHQGADAEAEPYRAWQTFTFTAASGHVREVDLFIATPGGLFLVEIKSHPGVATNNGSTWLFRDGSTTRTIENPLHFTDLKCKELKSQLEKAAREHRHALVAGDDRAQGEDHWRSLVDAPQPAG
jgi:hypothetical protein